MSVSVDEALRVLSMVDCDPNIIILPIEDALGYVVAQSVTATIALPRFNNSAMDGYGLSALSDDEYRVVQTHYAGEDKEVVLEAHEAIKIMTGAKVPSSVRCVIPQEDCLLLGNSVKPTIKPKEGLNIRYKGEDVELGERIVEVGKELEAGDIALLASQGIAQISVYQKLRVAVFATGEELVHHGEAILPHQIYNSNAPYFCARVRQLGGYAHFVGHAKDTLESTMQLIEHSKEYDLILTSGGVSVGERDYVKEAFDKLGFVESFSKIDVKPGKPTRFGKLGNSFVLNLPGNPLAAALIFELFGRVLINKMRGCHKAYPMAITATNLSPINQKPSKPTIIPGYLNHNGFQAIEKRSPGMVGTIAKANSFIVIDEGKTKIDTGELVEARIISTYH